MTTKLDSHTLNWYDKFVDHTVADAVFTVFDVALSTRERKEIRDEIYRQVNNAKVRTQFARKEST